MDYICRKLTTDDIELVMAMNQNYRAGFICYQNALLFLENPRNWLFAAVSDGKIIGFAYGYELDRLNDMGSMLYIHEVGVMEGFRRQGVGYTMLSRLKQLCKEKQVTRYFLSAYQNNHAANALYRKLGGIISSESQGNDTNYLFFTQDAECGLCSAREKPSDRPGG